jgi:hypothetical protein
MFSPNTPFGSGRPNWGSSAVEDVHRVRVARR